MFHACARGEHAGSSLQAQLSDHHLSMPLVGFVNNSAWLPPQNTIQHAYLVLVPKLRSQDLCCDLELRKFLVLPVDAKSSPRTVIARLLLW